MFAHRIEDHLEMGIVYNAMYPDAVQDDAALLQSADQILHDTYFRRIEVSGIQHAELRARFRQRLAVCRVNTSYLAQPVIFREGLDLGSHDPSERLRAMNRMRICMEEAEAVGADMIEMISGPCPAGGADEQSIRRFAESILELSKEAREKSLTIMVEMFDYDVDKKRLIGSVEDTIQCFQHIGASQSVQLLLDLSHIPMVRADIFEAVRQLSPWLGHVHVGNTVMMPGDSKYGDTHPYFGYPAGAIDIDQLATYFQALHEVGYIREDRSARLTFELICTSADRPADLMANAKRTLQAAWHSFLSKGGNRRS
ncbi:sugar phosphate isomerase/epimerase [Paenibacillus sp. SCIV0701]|uniref:Sugar phosphate isomerase/epimerase n=2 Tax=Paenibacillus soyae TaxID=2969249 RepID=A0A9X2MS54_9BACL|nr:sugar phosphate isomerase/epimerase [Paenibacillus soyae]